MKDEWVGTGTEGTLEALGRLACVVFPPEVPSSRGYMERLRQITLTDMYWAASIDPATKDELEVDKVYRGARAIAFHRLAHIVWTEFGDRDTALALSNQATMQTGVEIHPGARIGPSFSIDHGTGTVIGETTEIGTRCTVLNNVTLGARRAGQGAKSKSGTKRHPTIGNEVTICGNVGIYGAVTIGDGCWIGPHTQIDRDIPANTRVQLVSEYQVTYREHGRTVAPCIVKVAPRNVKKAQSQIAIQIEVENLSKGAEIRLVGKGEQTIEGHIASQEHDLVICSFDISDAIGTVFDVQVINTDGPWCRLVNCVNLL